MAAARRRTIIDGGMATTESASLYASSSRGSFLRDWKSHNPSEHETTGHEMLKNVHSFRLTSAHSIHIPPPSIPVWV